MNVKFWIDFSGKLSMKSASVEINWLSVAR